MAIVEGSLESMVRSVPGHFLFSYLSCHCKEAVKSGVRA